MTVVTLLMIAGWIFQGTDDNSTELNRQEIYQEVLLGSTLFKRKLLEEHLAIMKRNQKPRNRDLSEMFAPRGLFTLMRKV